VTTVKQLRAAGLILLLGLTTRTSIAALAAPGDELLAAPQESAAQPEPATLTIWNRPVFVFRAPAGHLTPQDRARAAERRIRTTPRSVLQGEIKAERGRIGDFDGVLISIDSYLLFGILPGDLDPEAGDSLRHASAQVVERLREALRARAEQRSLPLLLRGIAYSILATLILIAVIWGIGRIHRRLAVRLETARIHLAPTKVFGLDLRDEILGFERILLRLLGWGAWLLALYLWITFVFSQFPYTQPWGEAFGAYLFDTLLELGAGAIGALPGLGTVVVIFFVARFVTRLAGALFNAAESGAVAVPWLHPETVRATRRLALAVIWIFAIIVAYPYIPGSDTAAFQGVSVFVGLMVSLGATGVVNQVMSGLVVLYSRAIRVGEYVRIGEVEGVVTELGNLSTRIVTRRKEEITIPNAVLVGSTTTNYSRLAGAEGAIIPTTLTIGYDAPWRQVHAMLVLAAERTQGVKKEPRPRVLQKALSDFFVEYQLLVFTDSPEDRPVILSALHANILDAFNEFGVQIMSPHFESQPSERVVVPRNKWHEAPAASPPGRVGGDFEKGEVHS
jgi:small-conductance mechanosensitive channel